MGKKSGKSDRQWARTAANKIKRIEEALKMAGGSQVAFLKKRLEFWKSGKRVKKTGRKAA